MLNSLCEAMNIHFGLLVAAIAALCFGLIARLGAGIVGAWCLWGAATLCAIGWALTS